MTRISILVSLLVVVVIAITAFVYSHENDWTAAGTVCMAGIAGIGIVYSSVTVSLMKDEIRPYVFVDFIIDKDAPSVIDIELRNCGRSSAVNVNIEVVAPEKESEMVDHDVIFRPISEMSIFKNPIQYLPPDKSHTVIRNSRILSYILVAPFSDVF